MDLVFHPPDRLHWGSRWFRCAIGRNGTSSVKKEGDGTTPTGRFPLRRILYRADRMQPINSRLRLEAVLPQSGWCDAPEDPAYNRQVELPYSASCESLWRDDQIYDVVVVLGHNDDPVVDQAGSAVFLHVATPDYSPTAGCIAVALADLIAIVETCGHDCALTINP